MKKQQPFSLYGTIFALTALILLPFLSSCSLFHSGESGGGDDDSPRYRQVTLVWLKLSGNPSHRKHVLALKENFVAINGVQSATLGQASTLRGPQSDNSFDVAIELTFLNRDSMQRCMQDPAWLELFRVSIDPVAAKIVHHQFVRPFADER